MEDYVVMLSEDGEKLMEKLVKVLGEKLLMIMLSVLHFRPHYLLSNKRMKVSLAQFRIQDYNRKMAI
jgi:hypothetical protein